VLIFLFAIALAHREYLLGFEVFLYGSSIVWLE
jgi:hypothetical protein